MIGRTGASLVVRLAGIALGFAAMLMLARALDPAELGRWAWALELVALACVLAGAGFNLIAVRVVPDCLIARDPAGLRRFVRAGLVAGLAGSALFGVLLFIALTFGWLGADFDLRLAALMPGLLVAFTTLRFGQEVLRGAGRFVLAQTGEQLVWPLLLLLAALLLWFAPASAGEAGLLLAWQVLVFTLVAGVLLLTIRRIAAEIQLPSVRSPASAREWLAGGLPLALSAALSVFLNRGDMIALGALGDAREVAFYAPASRFAALLVLGQAAASMVSAGRMREFWRAGNRADLQHSLDQMAAISVLFALPFCLIFWLLPVPLLALFGAEFTAAAGVLQILVAAQLVNCWTGPVACAVVACDLERVFMVMTAAAAALLIVLLALLVPRWGMIGAALSSLAGIAALNLGMAAVVWRRTGLICWARPAGLAGLFGQGLHWARAR